MIERSDRHLSRQASRRLFPLITVLAVAGAEFVTPALAQTKADFRVVRRADRRGLIILLPRDRGGDSLNTSRFVLIDLDSRAIIALRPWSDVTRKGCPRPTPRPDDRICIVIDSAGAALDDKRRYVLILDSIPVRGAPAYIGAKSALPIEPVSGQVQAPASHPAQLIEITYDVDLSEDSSLAVDVFINGRRAETRCRRRPGLPRCYGRGTLSFKSEIVTPLRAGDSISAKFVRVPPGAEPVPAGPITPAREPARDSVTLATKDTGLYSLNVQGSYTSATTSRAGAVQVLFRNTPIPGTKTSSPPHYEGSLSPYVDVLWSSDANTKGYLNLGVQYFGVISELGMPLQGLSIFVTPRTESDKKATVVNFMYLDAEVRLRVFGLFAGKLPVGGYYRVWPGAGVELGHTIKGTDVARAESNNPSRWKAGVSVIARWPATKRHSSLCELIGCAGVDLSADWRHYWLDNVPAGTLTDWNYVVVTAIYKFTPNIGLSVGHRVGNPPPLFLYQRVTQVGIAIVR